MKKKKLDIIYEDKEIIVINKPAKLLTIATKNERINTLYHEVREYLYKKNQKVFIVHRLDKDTSGIILFAKNEKTKHLLQEYWNEITKREYVALVEGKMEKQSDTIKSYLKESKTLEVYETNKKDGKLAITNYKVIKSNNNYSLLNINILTGRKNQIRCQLSGVGHPIVGDKKYNSKKDLFRRLCLHSSKLILKHPLTNKEYIFESSYPKVFDKVFDK